LLPDWSCNVLQDSIFFGDRIESFGFSLHIIRLIGGIPQIHLADTTVSINNLEKSKIFLSYMLSLFQRQLADATVTLFRPENIARISYELLEFSEQIFAHNQEYGSSLVNEIMQPIFSLLNTSESGSLLAKQHWSGITRFISKTRLSSQLIHLTCHTISSVEQMALIIELCLERHFSINSNTTNSWDSVVRVLASPELEEEAFVRHCLQNALIMTLYTHFLQKLYGCGGKHDLRVMMGEQLAVWISAVNVEAIYPAGDSPGKERKMILLLSEYARLLAEEMHQLNLPQHHSRLRSLLPKIADSLMKWSEDRGTEGLWATIGLGPKSRLSTGFRLFSKIIGSFIAIRLLSNDADDIGWDTMDKETDESSKMISNIRAMISTREYEKLSRPVEDLIGYLQDSSKTLADTIELMMKLQDIIPELCFHQQKE